VTAPVEYAVAVDAWWQDLGWIDAESAELAWASAARVMPANGWTPGRSDRRPVHRPVTTTGASRPRECDAEPYTAPAHQMGGRLTSQALASSTTASSSRRSLGLG
jgi:hypothetical protein